jgi:hypothetical protein
MYRLSRSLKVRPSELILAKKRRKEHPMVALALDRAVTLFGEALTGDLEAVQERSKTKAKAKRERILASYLRPLGASVSQAQSFRDPAAAMKGKRLNG